MKNGPKKIAYKMRAGSCSIEQNCLAKYTLLSIGILKKMSQPKNDLNNLAELFLLNPRIAATKRFDAISLKIILGMQSELLEIESRGFQDIPSSGPGPSTVSQSSTGSEGQVGRTGEQLPTFDDVRKKMETYRMPTRLQ